MKEKKPFKVGATYKLDEPTQLRYTNAIRNKYGTHQFLFTVASIDKDGARDSEDHLIACHDERGIFTRVDNK